MEVIDEDTKKEGDAVRKGGYVKARSGRNDIHEELPPNERAAANGGHLQGYIGCS